MKAEFDSLKNNFQAPIDGYNTNIDNKIDGAIAAYLAAFNKQKDSVDSTLNRFSYNQRTFVQAISNPTTCTQDDIYIEESGYWVAAFPRGTSNSLYCGYALAGLVGYEGGHQKRLWPKNKCKKCNIDKNINIVKRTLSPKVLLFCKNLCTMIY